MKVIQVKRFISTMLLTGMFLLFSSTSCNPSQEELCNGSIATLREATFSVKVRVEYADFVPYEGPVRLRIFKTYCIGETSGNFTRSGDTDSQGLWDPHYNYFYKYGNLYDKVTVEWYASNKYGEHMVHSREYDYNAASGEMWILNSVQDVLLNWKSTD